MIALTDIILTLAGVIAGFTAGRLSKRPKPLKNTVPPCSCGHTRGTHLDGRGECQWSTWHNVQGYREVCHCQIWDGPERPEDIIRGFQL